MGMLPTELSIVDILPMERRVIGMLPLRTRVVGTLLVLRHILDEISGCEQHKAVLRRESETCRTADSIEDQSLQEGGREI